MAAIKACERQVQPIMPRRSSSTRTRTGDYSSPICMVTVRAKGPNIELTRAHGALLLVIAVISISPVRFTTRAWNLWEPRSSLM